MRERPILFSGPMVRVLLDGRKTVTRRVVKPQPEHHESIEWLTNIVGRPPSFAVCTRYSSNVREIECPYGQPGDNLWVRETWALEDCGSDGERVIWQADREAAWRSALDSRFYLPTDYWPDRWRPSIHMPRWASRLTLEVVSVRVARLHDITEEDALAEGVERHDEPFTEGWRNYEPEPAWESVGYHATARESFASLWRSINGVESWESNPWVWRVEFRRAAP